MRGTEAALTQPQSHSHSSQSLTVTVHSQSQSQSLSLSLIVTLTHSHSLTHSLTIEERKSEKICEFPIMGMSAFCLSIVVSYPDTCRDAFNRVEQRLIMHPYMPICGFSGTMKVSCNWNLHNPPLCRSFARSHSQTQSHSETHYQSLTHCQSVTVSQSLSVSHCHSLTQLAVADFKTLR